MGRTIITGVCLFTLFLAFSSCGNETAANITSDTEDAVTAAVDTEEDTTADVSAIPEPELPDLDYGGAQFTFYAHGAGASSYGDEWLNSDGLDGEVVNDAIYNRNMQVEDKFNIKLNIIEEDDLVNDYIRQTVQAQDSSVDVIDGMSSKLGPLAQSGYFYDLYTLPYLSLTEEYWNVFAAQDLTCYGKLYMMPSEISMAALANARFIYFNKSLIEDYDLESPYVLVDSNEWTLDAFLDYVRTVSVDVNGDGAYDKSDLFGMLIEDGEMNGTYMHLLTGCDVHYTEGTSDGGIAFDPNIDKISNIQEKVGEVFKDGKYCIEYNTLAKGADISGFNHLYDWGRSLFAAGHFLFVQNGMYEMWLFRDMEDDFGIVPNPKYDASQESYYHKADVYATMFAVPLACADAERAAAVLEYMSWLSHSTVLPAYYEVTIKEKRVRDENDVRMLNIIRTSIRYELCEIYDLGIDNALWRGYQKGDLASVLAKSENLINKRIEKLEGTFAELE